MKKAIFLIKKTLIYMGKCPKLDSAGWLESFITPS